MKLWTGRFKGGIDEKANDFNSSISFDSRMWREDIRGSIAHAEMLAKCGIITGEDGKKIVSGLKDIYADLERGKLSIDPSAEDIHTFVEGELTARIGDAGKRLHTARSRNDQVALDIRLNLLGECQEITSLIDNLLSVLCDGAEKYAATVMPGYTHLQRAQPVTLGHYMLAYAEMFLRDKGRIADCKERMNVSPLGSGALAGTTYPVDRASVADALGLSGVTRNSIDGVSDRDFVIELLSALSIIMVHLSRFAEELIMWCSSEWSFIEMDDAFSTGSSIMPQKKNPDIAELVRGKSGRVFGDLMTMLTVMKGLPLAYNKDMQEDKQAVFDAVDTVKLCLGNFTSMLAAVKVKESNMRAAAAGGFINATDCADYLVGLGLPFRDAYKCTGQLVARCLELGTTLEELPLEEYRAVCDLFDEGVYAAISLDKCVKDRSCEGAPSPGNVKAEAAKLKKLLK